MFIPTSSKNTKDIVAALKEQAPDLADVKFEKARDVQIGTKLLKLEEVLNERPMMKVGVIYIAKGQTSEDEFYSNGMYPKVVVNNVYTNFLENMSNDNFKF